ncbi:CsbD family protein [Streptomyces toxytricini]|uniref:CsbD family protein n=1 Tax=Streptomyces toxytricini TaxID=67369 RepID=A0ABW8EHW8_STRT5
MSTGPEEKGAGMSAREKMKAKTEQVVGKAMRKVGHALGDRSTTMKGGALQLRGKARLAREKGKDALRHRH